MVVLSQVFKVEEKNLTKKFIVLILSMTLLVGILSGCTETKKEEDKPENGETETIFSFTFGDETTNYTLENLESLEEFTGSGTYIKTGWLPDVVLDGPTNFTGIRVDTLLNQIDNLPDNYSIIVYASDEWTTEYNKSVINGQVGIYNESGNITQIGSVTMLFAYKKEGTYITDPEEGPIRVAFLDDGKITSSKLWAKMVVAAELIEQS